MNNAYTKIQDYYMIYVRRSCRRNAVPYNINVEMDCNSLGEAVKYSWDELPKMLRQIKKLEVRYPNDKWSLRHYSSGSTHSLKIEAVIKRLIRMNKLPDDFLINPKSEEEIQLNRERTMHISNANSNRLMITRKIYNTDEFIDYHPLNANNEEIDDFHFSDLNRIKEIIKDVLSHNQFDEFKIMIVNSNDGTSNEFQHLTIADFI